MAFDAFLHIPGVDGEATRNGFEKWIEIYSLSFGAQNPATIGPGSTGAGAGRATLSRLQCIKPTDRSSPLLFQFCASGEHFGTMKISLQKAGGEEPMTYLEYVLDNCYIESVSWSEGGTGDDLPMESLQIAFGKVTITYNAQLMTGAKDAKAVIGSWDVTTVST